MKMETKTIQMKGVDQLRLLGARDEYLNLVETAFPVSIVIRNDEIVIKGDQPHLDDAGKCFTELIFLVNRNGGLDRRDVRTVIDLIKSGGDPVPAGRDREGGSIIFYGKNGLIRPKTPGQDRYYQAHLNNDVVFSIGPAGTGKTYLAVAMALAKLREKEIGKLVLTRPAIEAGESLGFLPGDLMEKVDPYLRPLTDALFDMLPADQLQKYVDRKIVEIVPLAYMRGRTLNNAFVILDEAQNTSAVQMKMFLTRLGLNSRAIVTGDITQVDLPNHRESGLVQIQEILTGIDGIAFVYLDKDDVVRHRLVKDIIQAYEDFHQMKTEDGENT